MRLVSKETAKLAREKGFNQKVRAYYVGGKVDYIKREGLGDWNVDDTYSAPTQQQLQEWFMTEHKIYILPSPVSNRKDGAVSDWFFTMNKDHETENKEIYYFESETDWDTYWDALEAGLIEGLNRI